MSDRASNVCAIAAIVIAVISMIFTAYCRGYSNGTHNAILKVRAAMEGRE